MLSYASMIFDEAGSSMSPNISAIIVGGIQVFGVYCSTVLVDRAGRKFLMVSSAFGCALGMVMFAAYDVSKHLGVNVSEYGWIPLVSFSFVIFAGNLGKLRIYLITISCESHFYFTGIVSLPFLVLTEISPIKIKDVLYSINLSFSWLLAFCSLQVIIAFCNVKNLIKNF